MIPTRIPETEKKGFQAAVVALATLHGWLTYFTWRSIHSPAGFPDLVLVRPGSQRPGRMILAELKTDQGRLTAAQKAWLAALATVPGIEVYCWHPREWETIVDILQP